MPKWMETLYVLVLKKNIPISQLEVVWPKNQFGSRIFPKSRKGVLAPVYEVEIIDRMEVQDYLNTMRE
jgi:hypothetical protein